MASGTLKIKNGVDVTGPLSLFGASVFVLPTGTTADRPLSPELGMLRTNSTTQRLEYYEDGGWRQPLRASGDTMSGALFLMDTAPTHPRHAAPKSYVDERFDAIGGAAVDGKMNRSGDTMTGFLSLHADPSVAANAATKRYVDARDTAVADAAASATASVQTTANQALTTANTASTTASSRVARSGDTMTGTLGAPRFSVDTQGYLTINGTGNPVLNFDGLDYLTFTRAADQLSLVIAGASRLTLSTTQATFSVAPVWASDPTTGSHLTRKSYVDTQTGNAAQAPVSKSLVVGNVWAGDFTLLTADTEFFRINVPANTRRVIGSISASCSNESPDAVAVLFDTVLRNAANTEISRLTSAIARSQSVNSYYAQTGGTIGFNISAGNAGFYLAFCARKDQTFGNMHLYNYHAQVLFITE